MYARACSCNNGCRVQRCGLDERKQIIPGNPQESRWKESEGGPRFMFIRCTFVKSDRVDQLLTVINRARGIARPQVTSWYLP